jgi:hypothetical protein
MGQRLLACRPPTKRCWVHPDNCRTWSVSSRKVARNCAACWQNATRQWKKGGDGACAAGPEAPVCDKAGSEDCAGCSEALTARCVLYVGACVPAGPIPSARRAARHHPDPPRRRAGGILSRLPELIRGRRGGVPHRPHQPQRLLPREGPLQAGWQALPVLPRRRRVGLRGGHGPGQPGEFSVAGSEAG